MAKEQPKTFKEVKQDYLILKTVHNNLVGATEVLQEKYNKLLERNIFLEAQLVNAQASVDINKKIMIDSLTQHNEEKQNMGERIRELKLGPSRA